MAHKKYIFCLYATKYINFDSSIPDGYCCVGYYHFLFGNLRKKNSVALSSQVLHILKNSCGTQVENHCAKVWDCVRMKQVLLQAKIICLSSISNLYLSLISGFLYPLRNNPHYASLLKDKRVGGWDILGIIVFPGYIY